MFEFACFPKLACSNHVVVLTDVGAWDKLCLFDVAVGTDFGQGREICFPHWFFKERYPIDQCLPFAFVNMSSFLSGPCPCFHILESPPEGEDLMLSCALCLLLPVDGVFMSSHGTSTCPMRPHILEWRWFIIIEKEPSSALSPLIFPRAKCLD